MHRITKKIQLPKVLKYPPLEVDTKDFFLRTVIAIAVIWGTLLGFMWAGYLTLTFFNLIPQAEIPPIVEIPPVPFVPGG